MTKTLDKDGQEEAIMLLRCCKSFASYICENTKEARPITDERTTHILATNAMYYVQSCLKLVYERRLENDRRPLSEEELEKILALRDAAREVMPLADPPSDNENWIL